MCLLAPGRVISLAGDECEVETGGHVDRVSAFMAGNLSVGDWVLVTGGTVVRRLDPDQATAMSEATSIAFAAPDEPSERDGLTG